MPWLSLCDVFAGFMITFRLPESSSQVWRDVAGRPAANLPSHPTIDTSQLDWVANNARSIEIGGLSFRLQSVQHSKQLDT